VTIHYSLQLHSLVVVSAAAAAAVVLVVNDVDAALVIEPIELTLVHEDRVKAQQDVVGVVDDDGEHFRGRDCKRVYASVLLQEEDTSQMMPLRTSMTMKVTMNVSGQYQQKLELLLALPLEPPVLHPPL
jgi:hypothetical protein